jgi:hypothetical protein
VTLSATADAGSTFTGWSGGGCSGAGACTVTMDGAKSVTATFAANTVYALTVSKAGTGSGGVTSAPAGINCGATCASNFGAGTVVQLTPTPVAGSQFSGWSGACTGVGACSVTMNSAQSVTATFTPNASCSTPVSGTAKDSKGTITASPSSYGSCSMAGGNSSVYNCSFNAPQGLLITLTNARTTGAAADQYSITRTITASCVAQTNVNFQ